MEKILCAVRVRPASSGDKPIQIEGERSILVQRKEDSQKESFKYDKVFSETTENQEIFATFVEPLLQKAFSGYNVCVLTYGQTSSGKTHTMKGSSSDPGMVPRTLSWVMNALNQINTTNTGPENNSNNTVSCKISYLEIYNESVNDLLTHGNTNLDLITVPSDSQTKTIRVKNAASTSVGSYAEAMSL
jgi:Kinesin motor domain